MKDLRTEDIDKGLNLFATKWQLLETAWYASFAQEYMGAKAGWSQGHQGLGVPTCNNALEGGLNRKLKAVLSENKRLPYGEWLGKAAEFVGVTSQIQAASEIVLCPLSLTNRTAGKILVSFVRAHSQKIMQNKFLCLFYMDYCLFDFRAYP